MKVFIPGKTFLLGEYAVLQGGPAIIICTKPYFELSVLENHSPHNPFHADSPAGKFIADYHDIFKSLHLIWSSPYAEGGFGGSTAEFLACIKLYEKLTQQAFSQEHLYQIYLKYAYNQKGTPPSGMDLIAQAQMHEGIIYLESKTSSPIFIDWPFDDISLSLLKTSHKLPTHEHLQLLETQPDYTKLSELVLKGYQALKEKNKLNFLAAINDYAKQLEALHLTADSTKAILTELRKKPSFLAGKGCGAMGADVVAVISSQAVIKNNRRNSLIR